MEFEKIFDEKGMYVADGFQQGVCFEINEKFELFITRYQSKDDLLPIRENMLVYRGLFKKDYRRVNSRQQLFK